MRSVPTFGTSESETSTEEEGGPPGLTRGLPPKSPDAPKAAEMKAPIKARKSPPPPPPPRKPSPPARKPSAIASAASSREDEDGGILGGVIQEMNMMMAPLGLQTQQEQAMLEAPVKTPAKAAVAPATKAKQPPAERGIFASDEESIAEARQAKIAPPQPKQLPPAAPPLASSSEEETDEEDRLGGLPAVANMMNLFAPAAPTEPLKEPPTLLPKKRAPLPPSPPLKAPKATAISIESSSSSEKDAGMLGAMNALMKPLFETPKE
ncbi:unnamed protein product [Vitrella brassicaformis CCMP3155]|uniref:Uncharacterized protein n=1 Tax=Vitrella brassicaformis (strain CCMP3155) TaxID=1169540 RepID=A0A0G4FEM8_VITBC|nr:unnamed protein product [Vitrella brassicaformis CCMP3155]|eukprot:CEM11639.1 unnamed protein product [Vitrella brassicaformis CCMP3155]